MARGGCRPGAGRKVGSQNKCTRTIAPKSAAAGETPLEYMLRDMRTSDHESRRDAMAIAAAPFVHARLAAVQHSGAEKGPIAFQIFSGVPRDSDEHTVEGAQQHQPAAHH